MEDANLNRQIGDRLRAARARLGLSLEALSARAGVSRAMISRIERAEASPTATLLVKLCAALGLAMADLFAAEDGPPSPLARREAQKVWRDPASGYLRRDVSPPGTGSPVDIVDVTFPPGATVTLDSPYRGIATDQHVYLLEGALELTVGEERHALAAGDCLHMRLDAPLRYRNPGPDPARYLVILMLEPRRG